MSACKIFYLMLVGLPWLAWAQSLPQNTSFDLLPEAASLHKKDLNKLKTQSSAGDTRSQVLLGIAYQYGFGTKPNNNIAARWFIKAAKAGDPIAQVILGRLYTEGVGVSKNAEEALAWFRRAADAGNPEAQFELAESYADGRGVPADWSQAGALYRMAADNGYAPAKCSLRVNDLEFRPARSGATMPKVTYAPNPEYSEEARKAKFTGTVEVWIGLGEDGTVQEACVRRPLGLGLDENALDAVRRWRFEPGTLDGRPIPFGLRVTTSFNLH
jgi:TonB family protein